jgi:glycosyltransferase involved in cell wall biosynthesis
VKPIKIAILTSDKRDHDRNYADPTPEFGTAPEALLTGFAMLPEVEIHIVSCVQAPVNSPRKIAPNIYYHSLNVPKIGWMRTGYQGCIRATRKKLSEIRPDIVHGQGTERDCSISAVFSGFPNVLTVHGNMRLIARINRSRPFSFLWLAALLERFTLPRTDGVICITNYTRQAVSDLCRRTFLLPNAVDAGFFKIQNHPSPSDPPVGICVGAVSYRKNQNNFIRALDDLAKIKRFRLVFLGQIGNDQYSQEFLGLVKDRPWCDYRGFAGRTKLKEFFETATFAVLPTLEDNCPMVVIEAMAAGVPVLASKVGGVPDLIEPETTGLFCDPLKPDSFAAGVDRLLDENGLRQRLAVAAKIVARSRFHPEVIARRHVAIYLEILGQCGRAWPGPKGKSV